MIVAPSLIVASMTSQIGRTLGSIISTRSPRRTPRARRKLATRDERSASSAKLTFTSSPSSRTRWSAVRALPRARTSNQSSAQLKRGSSGQVNSRYAAA